MQPSDVDYAALNRLAAVRRPEPEVISVYLNLEPSDSPTPADRFGQLASLVRGAEHRFLEPDIDAGASHEARVSLRANFDRLLDFGRNGGLVDISARGLALFLLDRKSSIEVLSLPRGVSPSVTVDRSPAIAPLVDLVPDGRWCLLLVSRRATRIFTGTPNLLVERERLIDDVHRRHSQGGWSQARYQRGIEKEVHDHFVHSVALAKKVCGKNRSDHLAVGTSPEIWPELEGMLDSELREIFVGRLDIADVERISPEEAQQAVASLAQELQDERERSALERLVDDLGAGRPASAGLDETLAVLNERRVELLLLGQDAEIAGFACPTCGWLAAGAGSCPVDHISLEYWDDLVEPVVRLAIDGKAETLFVRDSVGELRKRGSIAALLRF